MANLIIKSTADNLVLKGSGGNSAVTVAAAGTTTFAENATLSGTANNLGTVATMTLPTASATAVYPAGHVVQTTGVTALASQTYTELSAPSSNAWTSTVVVAKITPIYSNSAIIINAQFGVQCGDSTSDFGYALKWVKTSSSLSASSPTGMSDWKTGSYYSSKYRYNFNYIDNFDRITNCGMDENVGVAGEEVTYTLYVGRYGLDASGNKLRIGASYNGSSHNYVQEIKR